MFYQPTELILSFFLFPAFSNFTFDFGFFFLFHKFSNFTPHQAKSPLSIACRLSIGVVKALVEHGADVMQASSSVGLAKNQALSYVTIILPEYDMLYHRRILLRTRHMPNIRVGKRQQDRRQFDVIVLTGVEHNLLVWHMTCS